VAALGTDTTLLVDTYDITRGIATAIEVAGPGLRAIRIDSGDLAELARQAREQLDRLGAPEVQIVVSGDLDEYSIAALRAEAVDVYVVGTSVVTGSGVPTAGRVDKLGEVAGGPVAKRSTAKVTRGGAKSALRRHKPSGTAMVANPMVAKARTLHPSRKLCNAVAASSGPMTPSGEQCPGRLKYLSSSISPAHTATAKQHASTQPKLCATSGITRNTAMAKSSTPPAVARCDDAFRH